MIWDEMYFMKKPDCLRNRIIRYRDGTIDKNIDDEIFLFFFGFTLMFCQKNQQEPLGSYSSPENTKLNQLKHGAFALDLNLQLNTDQTYEFTTCAQKSKGTWARHHDQLVLYCNETKMLVDSLNSLPQYQKGKICGEDFIFKIQKNRLIRSESLKNGKQIKYVLLKD